MLSLEKAHGIKYILDRLDRNKLKFQYEKRNEIEECLGNIFAIDMILKQLKKNEPSTFDMIGGNSPYAANHFVKSVSSLVLKIISLMKHEEEELEILYGDFKGVDIDTIDEDKQVIFAEETPEKGYALKLEAWASALLESVNNVLSGGHIERLGKLKGRLKQLVDDMKWFENELAKEHDLVIEAKRASQINVLRHK